MQQPPADVVELVTNLDDVSGEVIGDALAALLDDGALDAWTTPLNMKQGRPGVMLSLLCDPQDQARLTIRLMQLTGTFGVRHRTWQRTVLERRHVSVDTPYGPIRMKLGSMQGQTLAAKPEFADVRAAAAKHNVSPLHVLQAARAAYAALPPGASA